VKRRANWLVIVPLTLLVLGIFGALVARNEGIAMPTVIAVALPNLFLALLILGIIAWVIVRVGNRNTP
jgi:flagellar biogenesis protein FliO